MIQKMKVDCDLTRTSLEQAIIDYMEIYKHPPCLLNVSKYNLFTATELVSTFAAEIKRQYKMKVFDFCVKDGVDVYYWELSGTDELEKNILYSPGA
jgi:hypothetical protein